MAKTYREAKLAIQAIMNYGNIYLPNFPLDSIHTLIDYFLEDEGEKSQAEILLEKFEELRERDGSIYSLTYWYTDNRYRLALVRDEFDSRNRFQLVNASDIEILIQTIDDLLEPPDLFEEEEEARQKEEEMFREHDENKEDTRKKESATILLEKFKELSIQSPSKGYALSYRKLHSDFYLAISEYKAGCDRGILCSSLLGIIQKIDSLLLSPDLFEEANTFIQGYLKKPGVTCRLDETQMEMLQTYFGQERERRNAEDPTKEEET